jgi:ESS family glutamate:Na+ symporter
MLVRLRGAGAPGLQVDRSIHLPGQAGTVGRTPGDHRGKGYITTAGTNAITPTSPNQAPIARNALGSTMKSQVRMSEGASVRAVRARASRGAAGGAQGQDAILTGPVAPQREPPFSSDRWLPCLLWVLICLGAGAFPNQALAAAGIDLPGFLTAMLVGVAPTNAADLLRKPIDTEVTDLIGTLALRVLLAIALISLDWSSLVAHLPMILSATVMQIGAAVLVGIAVVFLLDGRDRDAAAASGSFMGFALGAMPVGLAVMRRLNARHGETARALLGITIAASLFQDTANAVLMTIAFRWLG